MRFLHSFLGFAMALSLAAPQLSRADDAPGDPTAVKQDEDGIWRDKDGDPTYKIGADGTVDWNTYSGFRRYHSECHVCHGPDGEGSSYAPALANSLKTIRLRGILRDRRQRTEGLSERPGQGDADVCRQQERDVLS